MFTIKSSHFFFFAKRVKRTAFIIHMLNDEFLLIYVEMSENETNENETSKIASKIDERMTIAELTRRFNRSSLSNLIPSKLKSSMIVAVESRLTLLSTTRDFSTRNSETLIMSMIVFDSKLSKQC